MPRDLVRRFCSRGALVMQSLTYLIAYLLASMGLTVLVLWPEGGLSRWLRERVLRPPLPRSARGVLDCYVCFSFWAGLLLSPLWWWWIREPWCWTGCLMAPAVFWIVLQLTNSDGGNAVKANDREDDNSPHPH